MRKRQRNISFILVQLESVNYFYLQADLLEHNQSNRQSSEEGVNVRMPVLRELNPLKFKTDFSDFINQ